MLKFFEFILSIFLIIVIFLKIPKDNVGLASFATKNEMFGSPSSAERFLNFLITISIIIYILIAIQLNFVTN